MSTLEVTAEHVVQAAQVAAKMMEYGLPVSFIAGALKLAQENRGAFELMAMWLDAETEEERSATVADIQELLDDVDASPSKPTQISLACQYEK